MEEQLQYNNNGNSNEDKLQSMQLIIINLQKENEQMNQLCLTNTELNKELQKHFNQN